MEKSGDQIRQHLIDYVTNNGSDMSFTTYFWKECEPLPNDIQNYSKFVSIVSDYAKEIWPNRMDMGVGMGSSTSWARLEVIPKLGLYLRALIERGLPTGGRVWLTMEVTHGHAEPIGQFIQVPMKIDT